MKKQIILLLSIALSQSLCGMENEKSLPMQNANDKKAFIAANNIIEHLEIDNKLGQLTNKLLDLAKAGTLNKETAEQIEKQVRALQEKSKAIENKYESLKKQ